MENLVIKASSDTYFVPRVNFDASSGVCWIEGESYLENTFDFYDKLIGWAKEYLETTGDKIDLHVKLIYYNTSSSRALLDLFKTLKEFEEAGKEISVSWYFPDPDDEEIEMEGEDYINDSGLNINLVQYSTEGE